MKTVKQHVMENFWLGLVLLILMLVCFMEWCNQFWDKQTYELLKEYRLR